MILFFISLFTIVVFSITLWWYHEFSKNEKYLSRYKGPQPLPIIGNILHFCVIKDAIQNALKIRDQFGDVVTLWLGARPRLLITGHKLTECVLGSNVLLEKSYEYKYLHAWLGTGLLTSSGTKWKQHRRLLTPAFHFQILDQYIGIFDSQTNTLIKSLCKQVGKGSFDIFPHITLCALDIICEAAMGTQVNAQTDSESKYVRSVKEMCRIVWQRALSPVKMMDTFFVFSRDYWKQKSALEVLHGYTDSVIMQRREELLQNNNPHKEDIDDSGIKRRLAFLDLLLQSTVDGKPLSNKCIREEVDTFMFEGHDTTTFGMSFALYSLSHHPDIQEKVVEELRCIFGNEKDRAPTYQDLQDMKYLEMVIKESLRLYPPVPSYSRTLAEDTRLDDGVLPIGLTLTIFTVGLHTQPSIFPNPHWFDPQRFSPENCIGRSPYAYAPFSAGPRNCIGQRFAMLEMKSTISKVLRHFEILPVLGHTPALCPDVILKSDNGLPVVLKERLF